MNVHDYLYSVGTKLQPGPGNGLVSNRSSPHQAAVRVLPQIINMHDKDNIVYYMYTRSLAGPTGRTGVPTHQCHREPQCPAALMETRSPSTTGDRDVYPAASMGAGSLRPGCPASSMDWMGTHPMLLGTVGSGARPGWVPRPSRSRANRPNDTFSFTKSSGKGGGIEALRTAIIRKSQSLPASQFLRKKPCFNFGRLGFTSTFSKRAHSSVPGNGRSSPVPVPIVCSST